MLLIPLFPGPNILAHLTGDYKSLNLRCHLQG